MGGTHAKTADEIAQRWLGTPGGRHPITWADQWRRTPGLELMADAFGQPFRGWPPAQLASLWDLIALWRAGRLHVAVLNVGAEPAADACRVENQATLTAGLPAG